MPRPRLTSVVPGPMCTFTLRFTDPNSTATPPREIRPIEFSLVPICGEEGMLWWEECVVSSVELGKYRQETVTVPGAMDTHYLFALQSPFSVLPHPDPHCKWVYVRWLMWEYTKLDVVKPIEGGGRIDSWLGKGVVHLNTVPTKSGTIRILVACVPPEQRTLYLEGYEGGATLLEQEHEGVFVTPNQKEPDCAHLCRLIDFTADSP